MSNFKYLVGDTIDIYMSWEDSEGTAISFISRTVRFVVREIGEATDVLFSADSVNNPDIVAVLEKTNPTKTGELIIKVSSEVTSLFPIGDLPYNIEVTDADGYVRTILKGRLNMMLDIAR